MFLRSLILLCLTFPCLATELRVCGDNRNVPPLVYVGGMGAVQYMLPVAADNLGITLSIAYHPQPRCLQEAATGHFDGLITASPNSIMNKALVFPHDASGAVDFSRAYLTMRVVAFRMKGNPSSWDGRQFINLRQPVLYETGVPAVQLLMEQLPAPSRASARTPVHMIEMMRLGRADIAIGLEPAVAYALQSHDPRHEFEILDKPLLESPIFLGLSKTFVAQHPQLAEALWDEIRRIKQSPEWLQIRDQVMNNQLPPDSLPVRAPGAAQREAQIR